MGPEQRGYFRVPADILTIVLALSVLVAVVLSFILLLGQVAQEQARMAREARASKARRLRCKEGTKEVKVPALASLSHHFHVFRIDL